MKRNGLVNRREFARRIAIASAAVSLGGRGPAGGAESQQKSSSKPAQRVLNETETVASPSDEAELLLRVVLQRYPDKRLDAATLESIRGELEANISLSRQLGRFPLKNSDQPAPVFAADRSSHSG